MKKLVKIDDVYINPAYVVSVKSGVTFEFNEDTSQNEEVRVTNILTCGGFESVNMRIDEVLELLGFSTDE